MYKKLIVLILFIFTVTGLNAKIIVNFTQEEKDFLAKHPVLKVHMDDNYTPFSNNVNGQFVGYSIDYANLIASGLGVTFEYNKDETWNQAVDNLKSKKIDIIAQMINTKKRRKFAIFTTDYFTYYQSIVVKNKNKNLTNLDKLSGKKVGVIKGFYICSILKDKYPKIKQKKYENNKNLIDALLEEEIDAIITTHHSIQYYITQQILNDVVKNIPIFNNPNFSHIYEAFGIRDDYPLLKSAMQKVMNNSKALHQKLKNEWFGVKSNKKFDYVLFSKFAIAMSLFVIFVLWRHYILQRANKKLEEARRIAEKSVKIKSEFLSNMSHEIRTPINAIIGLTHLALSSNSTNQQKEYLEDINTSSQVLLNIVNNILDFSKIEANKFVLENKEFNLLNLVNSIIVILTYQTHEKGLDLVVNSDIDENDIFNGDSFRISQVLINLVSNAIKFTPTGQIRINIKREDNQKILFEVIDSGIGLTQESQDKLFNPFVQADGSTTRQYGGTGLGLSISKQLIELMNGTIWVESQIGIGSKFSFVIDLEYIKNPQIKIESEDKQNIATLINNIKQLKETNILLVEDLATNQKIILGLLKKTNINIDIASNGQEACDKFNTNLNKYSLILMDLQMPIMGGLEATKLIREKDKTIPIIALSANAMKEDIEITKKAFMNEHLKKPIDVQKLYAVLIKYLTPKSKKVEFKYIDKDYALSLILNNEEIFYDILEGLLEYKDIRFEDLDDTVFKDTIHALKGISASAGAMKLNKIVSRIDKTQDRKLLGEFYEELGKVIGEIKPIAIDN